MCTPFDLKLNKVQAFNVEYHATLYTLNNKLKVQCFKCEDLGKWVISVLMYDYDGNCTNLVNFPTFKTKKEAIKAVVSEFAMNYKNTSYNVPSL